MRAAAAALRCLGEQHAARAVDRREQPRALRTRRAGRGGGRGTGAVRGVPCRLPCTSRPRPVEGGVPHGKEAEGTSTAGVGKLEAGRRRDGGLRTAGRASMPARRPPPSPPRPRAAAAAAASPRAACSARRAVRGARKQRALPRRRRPSRPDCGAKSELDPPAPPIAGENPPSGRCIAECRRARAARPADGLLPVAPVPPCGVPPNGCRRSAAAGTSAGRRSGRAGGQAGASSRRERDGSGARPGVPVALPERSRPLPAPGAASTHGSAAPYRRDRHLELRPGDREGAPGRREPTGSRGRERGIPPSVRRAARRGERFAVWPSRRRPNFSNRWSTSTPPPPASPRSRRRAASRRSRAHAAAAGEVGGGRGGVVARPPPRSRPSRTRCASATSSATTA